MRGATGVLLVGGASERFGSPKALARLGGRTLAEICWDTLGACCAERIAVGKRSDALPLPFPLLDDGTDVRHPAAGILAGLRAARYEVAVAVPVDCPALRADSVVELAAACADAAFCGRGRPLPGAFRKTALPALERVLEKERPLLAVARELDVRVIELDPWELADADTPAELAGIGRRSRAGAEPSEVGARQGASQQGDRGARGSHPE